MNNSPNHCLFTQTNLPPPSLTVYHYQRLLSKQVLLSLLLRPFLLQLHKGRLSTENIPKINPIKIFAPLHLLNPRPLIRILH